MNIVKNIKTIEMFEVVASSGKLIQSTSEKKLKALLKKEEDRWAAARDTLLEKEKQEMIKKAVSNILDDVYPKTLILIDEEFQTDDNLRIEKFVSYNGSLLIKNADNDELKSTWFSNIIGNEHYVGISTTLEEKNGETAVVEMSFHFCELKNKEGKDFSSLEREILKDLRSDCHKPSINCFIYHLINNLEFDVDLLKIKKIEVIDGDTLGQVYKNWFQTFITRPQFIEALNVYILVSGQKTPEKKVKAKK